MKTIEPNDAVLARLSVARAKRELLGIEAEPVAIDRYVLEEPIGRGGNGVVYKAVDPKLDRTVAVKLLLGPAVRASIDARYREAQALASVRHPNVVEVFDTGIVRLGLPEVQVPYIVMEFLVGQRLHEWFEAEPVLARGLDVLAQCARGLAAAHATGVVHCDIKPTNIMVLPGGRAKLIDFGLARMVAVDGSDVGTGEGTHQYMAPEQRSGGRLGHLVDQFGLCRTFSDVLGTHAPPEVDALLRRGCEEEPEDRFADMQEFVDQLATVHRVQRTRWHWWVGGGVAAAAAVALAAGHASRREPTCALAKETTASLERVAASSALADARPALRTAITTELEAQRHRITDGLRQACTAEPNATVECLRRTEAQLRTAAEVIADASADAPVLAVVSELDDVAQCDADPIGALGPEREAFEREHMRARLLLGAGRADDAAAALTALREHAFDKGWQDAVGRIEVTRSQLEYDAGQFAPAGDRLKAVYFGATSRDDLRLAADASRMLVEVRTAQGDLEGARTWGKHAHAHYAALGLQGSRAAAILGQARGMVELYLGDYTQAEALLTVALERLSGPAGYDPAEAGTRMHLAIAEIELGKIDAAVGRLQTLLEERVAVLGPDHPHVGLVLQNQGNAYVVDEKWDDALEVLAEAERVATQHHKDGDGPLETLRLSRAQALLGKGAADEARTLAEKARAALPAAHPAQAVADLVVARSIRDPADLDNALSLAEKARAAFESQFGDAHPSVADAMFVLGEIHSRREEPEAARRAYEAAVAIYTTSRGPDHPFTRQARAALALDG